MPLQYQELNSQYNLYLWEVTESSLFFIENSTIRPQKLAQVMLWNSKRRREWFAGRYMLERYLGGSSWELCIDEHGKPFIPNSPWYMSITHSRNWVGLVASRQEIGVDIQNEVAKITRLAHKFVHDADIKAFPEELSYIEQLHYLWAIKEAVYKAYGRREIAFKTNIRLLEIEKLGDKYIGHARIGKGQLVLHCRIECWRIKGFYMTIAWIV